MANRRSLVKLLAGAALLGVSRTASVAQKAKSFTITYLALLPGEDRSFVPNFLRRLDQLGYVNGKNLHFVYRCAEGHPEFLPRLASDLIEMKPDVLVTGFGTVAAKAGKAAQEDIPVVFMAVGDPVGAGVVGSLARPGGNVTGLSDLPLVCRATAFSFCARSFLPPRCLPHSSIRARRTQRSPTRSSRRQRMSRRSSSGPSRSARPRRLRRSSTPATR